MNKNNFIRCFFIINVVVCLLRLETGLCMAADHSPAITKSVIELVVPESPSYSFTNYSAPSFTGQSPEFSSDDAILSSINKYTFIDYNAFALRIINLSNHVRSYSFLLVSILHKFCVWHQSSSDLPPLAV
jgi:hypothetical protein